MGGTLLSVSPILDFFEKCPPPGVYLGFFKWGGTRKLKWGGHWPPTLWGGTKDFFSKKVGGHRGAQKSGEHPKTQSDGALFKKSKSEGALEKVPPPLPPPPTNIPLGTLPIFDILPLGDTILRGTLFSRADYDVTM